MTAVGDSSEAERLRRLWAPTLGATVADGDWNALPAGATYKPAATADDLSLRATQHTDPGPRSHALRDTDHAAIGV